MHDAIALANLLYCMPTRTSEDITRIFEEYQKERLPAVTQSYNHSRHLAKISGRGLAGSIALYLSTHIPMWLWKLAVRYNGSGFYILHFYTYINEKNVSTEGLMVLLAMTIAFFL